MTIPMLAFVGSGAWLAPKLAGLWRERLYTALGLSILHVSAAAAIAVHYIRIGF